MSAGLKAQVKQYVDWLDDYEPGSREYTRLAEIIQQYRLMAESSDYENYMMRSMRIYAYKLYKENEKLKAENAKMRKEIDLLDADMK